MVRRDEAVLLSRLRLIINQFDSLENRIYCSNRNEFNSPLHHIDDTQRQSGAIYWFSIYSSIDVAHRRVKCSAAVATDLFRGPQRIDHPERRDSEINLTFHLIIHQLDPQEIRIYCSSCNIFDSSSTLGSVNFVHMRIKYVEAVSICFA